MAHDLRSGGIAVIDYGSQYTQLIARRVRELNVYAEVFPYDVDAETLNQHAPRGYILSGGPNSVYDDDAYPLGTHILQSQLPALGVCYGMQVLAHTLGGQVAPGETREYGDATITHAVDSTLFHDLPAEMPVWMSHSDHVIRMPEGFVKIAESNGGMLAAMGDAERGYYGVQFHPEVAHTPQGIDLLRNFVFDVCGCEANWSPVAFIEDTVERVRETVGNERVLLALSGGVDSAVAGALLNRAIGDQLTSVYVNTGMMRMGESDEVVRVFREQQGMNLIPVDATEEFLSRLQGVTEPERKRKIIGSAFIDTFEQEANKLAGMKFLAQGTIYPDVIESAAGHKSAKTIKSHHNVGGLPPDFLERFALLEPLRDLFKDEVRKVGEALGLPPHIVWRQPFPGPGLAIRCLGELTWERLEKLRRADAIYLEELDKAGLLYPRDGNPAATSQCFAVLLPVKSVGVMGDNRTYEEVCVLRAVQTDDFMTAQWARLPYELLAKIAGRIVNEINGINRVTYDITSKPPATIEWE